MASIPRIGIDAMGGDFGPQPVAEGVARALRDGAGRFQLTLVGDEGEIRAALRRAHVAEPVDVVHAPEKIDMDEKAAAAARRGQSSVAVLMRLHKEGKLDAVFSAGNTGAVMTVALLTLGRLEGISRPALAAYFPNSKGHGTVVLDVGANADVKPSYLVQFAHMGAVYARYMHGRDNPRVGLLSIGEEETKGNALVQEAIPLLKAARHLNFIGNVEGRDLFKDTADVVVTDGFTGNVVLKTAESAATFLLGSIRSEVKRDPLALFGALLMQPAIGRLRKSIDWEEHGAAPLLGVNGGCFIGHGSSKSKAFASAIRTLTTFVEKRVNQHILEEIQADHVTAA